MFEQSFVGRPSKARTGWTLLVSFSAQSTLLVVGVLVPLFNPELLPRIAESTVLRLTPPPGKPPAPPPEATVARKQTKAPPSQVFQNVLLAPLRVPQKVELFTDEFPPAQVGTGGEGVLGGIGAPGDTGVPSTVSRAHVPAPPPSSPVEIAKPKEIVRMKVGGEVQKGLLVNEVIPVYPRLAVQTRIEGKVMFKAVISASGMIMNLQLLSGHPMLAPAAAEAVKQWRYKPTLLNGDPVEVDTVIEVNFRLNR